MLHPGRPWKRRKWAALEQVIAQHLREGRYSGVQIAAELRGVPVLHLAVGCAAGSRNLTPASRVLWRCAGKPTFALAVARLVAEGRLALDAPVSSLLPDLRQWEGITLRHILTHACVIEPDPPLDELSRGQTAGEALRATRAIEAWPPGTDFWYSPWAGWAALSSVIAVASGEPAHRYLRRAVFAPLDMSRSSVGLDPREYQECVDDGVISAPGDAVTIWEHPEWLALSDPSFGTVGPIDDLVKMYSAVLRRDTDAVAPFELIQTLVTPVNGDSARVRVGLGFICDPRRFGDVCSDRVFGHGAMEHGFAFADQRAGIALGAAFAFDSLRSDHRYRQRDHEIVHAVYGALGAHCSV